MAAAGQDAYGKVHSGRNLGFNPRNGKVIVASDFKSIEVTAEMRAGVFAPALARLPSAETCAQLDLKFIARGKQHPARLCKSSGTRPRVRIYGTPEVMRTLGAKVGDVIVFAPVPDSDSTFNVSTRSVAGAASAADTTGADGGGAATAMFAGSRTAATAMEEEEEEEERTARSDGSGEAREGMPPTSAGAAAAASGHSLRLPPAERPGGLISHLHGYLPPHVSLPEVQPDELQVCGLVFHPRIKDHAVRSMDDWLAARGCPLRRLDVVQQQMQISGIDGAATGGGAAATAKTPPPQPQPPWVTPFQQRKLRRNIICNNLARLLGLTGDKGAADAPLPKEARWLLSAVRICSDRRRGGIGLAAAADIKKDVVLGVVAGYVLPTADRTELLSYASCSTAVKEELKRRVDAAAARDAWSFLAEAFQMPYAWPIGRQHEGQGQRHQPPAQEGTSRQPPGATSAPPPAVVSMVGYGNLAALINDPRVDMRGEDADNDVGDAGAVENANCMVLPVCVRGLVLPVVVALRNIAAGEPLLRDYGRSFWRRLTLHAEILQQEYGISPERVLHAHDEPLDGYPPAVEVVGSGSATATAAASPSAAQTAAAPHTSAAASAAAAGAAGAAALAAAAADGRDPGGESPRGRAVHRDQDRGRTGSRGRREPSRGRDASHDGDLSRGREPSRDRGRVPYLTALEPTQEQGNARLDVSRDRGRDQDWHSGRDKAWKRGRSCDRSPRYGPPPWGQPAPPPPLPPPQQQKGWGGARGPMPFPGCPMGVTMNMSLGMGGGLPPFGPPVAAMAAGSTPLFGGAHGPMGHYPVPGYACGQQGLWTQEPMRQAAGGPWQQQQQQQQQGGVHAGGGGAAAGAAAPLHGRYMAAGGAGGWGASAAPAAPVTAEGPAAGGVGGVHAAGPPGWADAFRTASGAAAAPASAAAAAAGLGTQASRRPQAPGEDPHHLEQDVGNGGSQAAARMRGLPMQDAMPTGAMRTWVSFMFDVEEFEMFNPMHPDDDDD